jgi:hypothetical protein
MGKDNPTAAAGATLSGTRGQTTLESGTNNPPDNFR